MSNDLKQAVQQTQQNSSTPNPNSAEDIKTTTPEETNGFRENAGTTVDDTDIMDRNNENAQQYNKITIFLTFSKNLNFLITIFIYILCIVLSFTCILYAFGQITELQLTNYWCKKKDLNEIYEHSLEYNLNEGTSDGCWKSKQFTVNEITLRDATEIYKSYTTYNIWNIFKFIIWFIYGIWFISLIFLYTYYYINDFIYVHKKN